MTAVPYQKLHFFREKLGLDEKDFHILEPYREVFIRAKEDFAAYFSHFFLEIPGAAMFLKHYGIPGFLNRAWAQWFENLFVRRLDDGFLEYLWKVGIRHVEVNLDQRYASLGFSIARQFCEELIRSEIPPDKRGTVLQSVNKLIDFCLLVETNAYIEAHARCDMEIINGVADRVRNKITAIGGSIKRLQRKTDPQNPVYGVYDTLVSDSAMCEQMVTDTKTFIELSRREPETDMVSLERLVTGTLERLSVHERFENIPIEIKLDETTPFILGDRHDMELLFFHLLQNSFEAVNPGQPYIRVSSHTDPLLPNRITVEIFNTGIPISTINPDQLFSPFFSTKFSGTGFGLSIANLAVKKNYGTITFIPDPEKGTTVTVTLPVPVSE